MLATPMLSNVPTGEPHRGSGPGTLRDYREHIDVLWPGDVVSYKAHVRGKGLGSARIVYFHGVPKPPAVDESWVTEYWN
ncbi:MAG: hypothetical protein EOS76_01485 [Mesorhizobium sp.]|nr:MULTISPECIES: hypothetical protein [unclassified Mesorhizobium]AZO34189.1 hypothetical protein EJ072_06695 [Mesorhizobium sp. M2A.F.Ca.ET.046.03.2.1]RVC82324.1 hypothetical protein EN766_01325 [Mesorhizobium sp. M2A.F.Ca.ET.046.02.1.1]RWB49802.1 MAG: hypothetical protein EOQ44_01395 [Mesorhizobium sp.]RWE22498.1 MAG: hypothetical protein EOS76_01485 [Mesorhizobium sp.]